MGRTKAVVRDEGQHVEAAKPTTEWVDDALRNLPTPYAHAEYVPVFDGALAGADDVRASNSFFPWLYLA